MFISYRIPNTGQLKYKQTENKVLKKIFLNSSCALLSLLSKKCFCFKRFFMFSLSVKKFAFCHSAFVSSGFFLGVWVKMLREWSWNQNYFNYGSHGLWLTSRFAHSLSSPKTSTGCRLFWRQPLNSPEADNQFNFNFLHSISTFCTKKKIIIIINFLHCLELSDVLSANERTDIFACINSYARDISD